MEIGMLNFLSGIYWSLHRRKNLTLAKIRHKALFSHSHSKNINQKSHQIINKDHLFVLQSRKRNFVFILYSNKCFWNSNSVLCKQISTFWDFTIYPGLCVLHGLEILHALVSHNFVEKNPHHRLKKIKNMHEFRF